MKREYIDFSMSLKNNYAFDKKIDHDTLIFSIGDNNSDTGINLCTFDRQVDKVKDDSCIKLIHENRNHILQVFMHPKLHLKNNREILPIEVVSRIDHESIRHLASHCEHWESRRVSGLIPSRLFAPILEDNYAIYENVVAKNLVDRLYNMILKRRKILKDLDPGKESYTALNNEMTNVFVAQGLLFKGYSETTSISIAEIADKQGKMVNEVLDILILCKESKLYEKLKKAPKTTSPIKTTNIFLMDRHYKYIYKLWNEIKWHQETTGDYEEDINLNDEYSIFCKIIFSFALENFNFSHELKNPNIFENGEMCDQKYIFKDWRCTVHSRNIESLNTSAFSVRICKKIQHEIDVSDFDGENIFNINGTSFENGKLTITGKINRVEIEQICYKIFSDSYTEGKNGKRHYRNTDNRRRLRAELTEKFFNIPDDGLTLLFLPLKFKFLDSEKETRDCITELKMQIQQFIQSNEVDYCYFLTPFRPTDYDNAESYNLDRAMQLLNYPIVQDSKEVQYGMIPISIADINSYRRMTKIVLTHMIQIDKEHLFCPICGNKFRKIDGAYLCYCTPSFELRQKKCSNCHKNYLNSKFAKPSFPINDKNAYKLMMNEIRNGFKNITDVDIDSQHNICPHCKTID
jgi:hypothetical protein